MDDFSEWSCKVRVAPYSLKHNDDHRRWYQRDTDQIIHSIAFRKLQQKSQLLSEKDPRSRSRLIHTLEVSRIAIEISERLGLDKELTEAISMGHDIATSPYGSIGNDFLREMCPEYTHELAGAHILYSISSVCADDNDKEKIEYAFRTSKKEFCFYDIEEFPKRLYASKMVTSKSSSRKADTRYFSYHISEEIIDGVTNHGRNGQPCTLEGQVVRFADNIAYLTQDVDDLISVGIIDALKDYSMFHVPTASIPAKGETRGWKNIDEGSKFSLREAFEKSRGLRISAFIERFVDYNKSLLANGYFKDVKNLRFSSVLKRDIPMLQIDDGLEYVISSIWELIERQYNNPLIRTSNAIQLAKITQLWDILHTSSFTTENKCYAKFVEEMSNSRYDDYPSEWKNAFFISHLSWSEVDLIIDSFHKRDYTFDIDIELGGAFNANC